jgi:RNA polymerase sigma-70 factor, ECF subfamily
MRVIANVLEQRGVSPAEAGSPAVLDDIGAVYAAHADFVWASLHRLGVRDVDREDVLQEVFVIVHRKLATFDGSAKITTWLFAICLRVVAAYRRRGFRRHETSVAEVPDARSPDASPEQDLATAESRRRLEALLDELDLERRAVFVMFELDEMACEEIASIVGVPVGTVYSRLHAARKDFQKALARMHARDAHGASTTKGRWFR